MNILAIDPGPERSAYVLFDGQSVRTYGILPNEDMISHVGRSECPRLAIEGIECLGMPVGREVFSTCIWIGRYMERFGSAVTTLIYRREVKLHLCGSMRAKDPMIRQALIDRFGPGREKAIGTKKQPGPCYGIASHCWSALSIAVYWWDVCRVVKCRDAGASTPASLNTPSCKEPRHV